jgi:hypothetical protein
VNGRLETLQNIPSTVHEHLEMNQNIVDVYLVLGLGIIEEGTPFVTTVKFHGLQGEITRLTSVVDDGSMINAIDAETYKKVRHRMPTLQPLQRLLQMANRVLVPLQGAWKGKIGLGEQVFEAQFEVFPSGKSWAVLIGKALLLQVNATHVYCNPEHLWIPGPDGGSCIENAVGRTQGMQRALMMGVSITTTWQQQRDIMGGRAQSPRGKFHPIRTAMENTVTQRSS